MQELNPHISVDCVIFGFDGEKLKVLLLRRQYNQFNGGNNQEYDYKLPGDFITDEEDLDSAASRVLHELTGLSDIYLQQFYVFGSPARISSERDLNWLRKTTGLPVERVVTVAYYSLIKIDESRREPAEKNNAGWFEISAVRELAFDHTDILKKGLHNLRTKLQYEPVGVQLLPEKFTIRQLQNLYEVILGRELDNRNFRKKVLKADYLVALDEKEQGVAHKPARLFRFDRKLYDDRFNRFEGFQF
ncbi:MAG TPA: NUDIX domain-containing protein [Bacteroidales bacterium]|nr:NUDIX domain-containing protein [Bacteroidales bacterium]